MAVLGQVGFDEGGVLQALSKPPYSVEWWDYDRDKKGRLLRKTHHTLQISITHVIAALVIVFGPWILLKFNSQVLSNPEVRTAVSQILKPDIPAAFTPGKPSISDDALAAATATAASLLMPGLPTDVVNKEQMKGVVSVARKILDPFGFFK